MHKLIRLYRENAARKTNLGDNLFDIMKCMWIRTDFMIQAFKRVLVCKYCKNVGHTVRSCQEKNKSGAETLDDEVVESFFISEDEDESLASTFKSKCKT